MRRIYIFLLASLGLFLPLHGGISVFLPENFRWWKEIILIIFLVLVLAIEIRNILQNGFIKTLKTFSKSEFFAKFFTEWGILLILISGNLFTSLIAFRYLGLFYLVYLIFSRFFKSQKGTSYKNVFANFFILGLLVSVFFGIWVKFAGGDVFVLQFYSNTISSWVPTQTIPAWHEINGIIRMQGFSSGPIEFSHLLVGGIAILPFLQFRKISRILLSLIFLLGIWQSASRSAMIGSIIVLSWQFWEFFKLQNLNIKKWRKFFITIFGMVAIILLFSGKHLLTRIGDSEHFQRPIKAIEKGLENPILGNLGEIGSAFRLQNLRENNDDKALITENVLADTFAQTGLVGLFLVLLFWFNLGKELAFSNKKMLGFYVAVLVMIQLATVFDMTPLAISWAIIFSRKN